MIPELSHDEAFAALDAAALDALDSAEREAVLAHAEGCESCRVELAALRATAAQLAFASSHSPGPVPESRDRIRARLTARAAADAKVRGLSVARVNGPDLSTREYRAIRTRINVLAWRRAEWLAVAAGALLIIGVGVMASVLRDRENLKDALAGATASTQRSQRSTDSLRALVMYKDSLIAGITGRDVAMVQLTSSAARAPNAMMFWDRSRNGWTLIAHNLPMPRAGRTYQLWLVTPTAKISAGTFMPDNGEAMVRATYALARDSLRAVAVTDEPAGGMPQPTGQFVVIGNATK